MYIARDVPFAAYDDDAGIARAAARMSELSGFIGPRAVRGCAARSGQRRGAGGEGAPAVLPQVVFRGDTDGDLVGPYVSQLLLLPFTVVAARFDQRYRVPLCATDAMRTWEAALAAQHGACVDDAPPLEPLPRYIRTGRDLAWYVGADVSFQAYMHAALLLHDAGAPFAPCLPYDGRPQTKWCTQHVGDDGPNDARAVGAVVAAAAAQHGCALPHPQRDSPVSCAFPFGMADVLDALARAAACALEAARRHKWSTHRRLRPEAMAMLVDRVLRTDENPFDLHSDLLDSRTMHSVFHRGGNLLLPQVYPAGSPCHPSYPSSHAAIAGACSVVLKAFFDERWRFPLAVCPDETHRGARLAEVRALRSTLTLRGEVDKLASNMALGRCWAGIHYRSDVSAGWLLGERVAVRLLGDVLARHPDAARDPTRRFEFHLRDGTRTVVRAHSSAM